MDDRRRLLERLYSREGAAEQRREYRDPGTGATVWATPSEWALAEYDRAHRTDHDEATEQETPREEGAGSAGGGIRGIADGPDHDLTGDGDSTGVGDSRNGSRTPPWRRAAPVLIAAGTFVLGVLVAVGVSAALGRGAGMPAAAPTATSVATGMPDSGEFHPLPGPAIEEYFRHAPPDNDLPAAVTSGFVSTSFHEIAGTVVMQESAAIYAAKRLDGQYCLVAVADGQRVAETCATETGIADHGLTLAKDVVRDVDGRPMTVTVTWHSDGTISWTAMPSAG